MKKVMLSFLALAACTAVRAQNMDIFNNTSCAVTVEVRAFQNCAVVGYEHIIVGAYSSVTGLNQAVLSSATPPTWASWPVYDPAVPYSWGYGFVGVSNPSYGYEPYTFVGDDVPSCAPGINPLNSLWFNPTCGLLQNVTWTPAPTPTGTAVLTIN